MIEDFELLKEPLKTTNTHTFVSHTSRKRASTDLNERGVTKSSLTEAAQQDTGAFIRYHNAGLGVVEQHTPL